MNKGLRGRWRKRKARIAYRKRLDKMTDQELMREMGRSIEIAATSIAYEIEKRRLEEITKDDSK